MPIDGIPIASDSGLLAHVRRFYEARPDLRVRLEDGKIRVWYGESPCLRVGITLKDNRLHVSEFFDFTAVIDLADPAAFGRLDEVLARHLVAPDFHPESLRLVDLARERSRATHGLFPR